MSARAATANSVLPTGCRKKRTSSALWGMRIRRSFPDLEPDLDFDVPLPARGRSSATFICTHNQDSVSAAYHGGVEVQVYLVELEVNGIFHLHLHFPAVPMYLHVRGRYGQTHRISPPQDFRADRRIGHGDESGLPGEIAQTVAELPILPVNRRQREQNQRHSCQDEAAQRKAPAG